MYLVKSNDLPKSARKLAKSASREFQHTKGQLSKQINELYPEIASAVRELATRAAEQGRVIFSATGRELGVVGNRAIHFMDSSVFKAGMLYGIYRWLITYPEVTDAAEKVKEQIREKPVESAIIAAGVGYLIGRLLRW